MSRHLMFPLVTALALAAPIPSMAVAPPADAAPQQSVGEAVAYADLEHRVGDTLLIETIHNTVRRGVLVKYTNPGLTLQLGPEHGAIELSVPRETIRSVRVLDAAPDQAR